MSSRNRQRKVLLVTPPYHAGVVESAGRWPNLAFTCMAGSLRDAGFEVEIYDAMTRDHDIETVGRRIEEARPDFVCTTAFTPAIYAAMDVLRVAKEVDSSIVTVAGGVHVNFCYEEALRGFADCLDYVVRGEGEETLVELAQAVVARGDVSKVRGLAYLDGQGVAITPSRPFVSDLDALKPAWDLVDWSDYTLFPLEGSRLAIVNSSRGCPHNCAFCSQQKFWERGWRARSPESFVDELESLVTKHGVDVVMLSDEYPTPDRRRWERVLDLLIERDLGLYLLLETRVNDIIRDAGLMWKYRAAGVVHVYVGVEATGQERLDVFRKGIDCEQSREAIRLLNDVGIVTECSFVLGLPHETPETIAETLDLARIYDPDLPQFLMIAPWPYSDMYKDLEDYIITRDYSKYNFVEPVVKPRNMTAEGLQQSVVDCYRQFYSAKARDYANIKDDFKREYLLDSMRAMMKNSFLAKHIKVEEATGHIETDSETKSVCARI